MVKWMSYIFKIINSKKIDKKKRDDLFMFNFLLV